MQMSCHTAGVPRVVAAHLYGCQWQLEDMEQIARVNKNRPYYTASQAALEGYLAFKLKFTEERQAVVY
jgi:hypothetical protein